jgi:hypothetical protein
MDAMANRTQDRHAYGTLGIEPQQLGAARLEQPQTIDVARAVGSERQYERARELGRTDGDGRAVAAEPVEIIAADHESIDLARG